MIPLLTQPRHPRDNSALERVEPLSASVWGVRFGSRWAQAVNYSALSVATRLGVGIRAGAVVQRVRCVTVQSQSLRVSCR